MHSGKERFVFYANRDREVSFYAHWDREVSFHAQR